MAQVCFTPRRGKSAGKKVCFIPKGKKARKRKAKHGTGCTKVNLVRGTCLPACGAKGYAEGAFARACERAGGRMPRPPGQRARPVNGFGYYRPRGRVF